MQVLFASHRPLFCICQAALVVALTGCGSNGGSSDTAGLAERHVS